MPVAPSVEDMLAQFEAEALAQLPALVFQEGDVSQAQQHGCAAMADACIRFTVQSFRDTFIDGAKGTALATLVDDHTNVQKQPGTAAQVTLTFVRTGGGAGGSLLAGFQVASEIDSSGNTVVFTTDTPVVFSLGDNGPHDAVATAAVVGRSGNVAAGKITRKISTPFSSLVTVTNAATAGGGNDEESDDELRVRARNFWQTLRRGTLGALEFGALRVPAVRISKAIEDPDTGLVTLVVSDSDGNSTAQMIADTILEIENWRAPPTVLTVTGGTQLVVDVTGVLTVAAGVDPVVLGPVCAKSIAGRMSKLKQSETLTLDTIKAAAINVDPDAITALTLSLPLADVVPTSTQVIRPGTITIT